MILIFKAPSVRASYNMRLLDIHATVYNASKTNVRVKETTKAKTARNELTRNDIVKNQGGADAVRT